MTLNKLSTRLPILLAQINAGNNSFKLKNEIRQILYLLYQHNKITKKSLQQLNKVIIDLPKDVDKNLKYEIKFIIKRDESLAENKTKKEIEQLVLKHKLGNYIHEHRKQQKRINNINFFLAGHKY